MPILKYVNRQSACGTSRAWIISAMSAGYLAIALLAPALLARAANAGGKKNADSAEAANSVKKKKDKPDKSADPAGNLKLLNQWGEQTTAAQSLYEAVFKAFVAKSNATYADLAGDPEVQRLCTENGIAHLGGPMLGTVAPDGARVWLRTLRPAKVEARVTVDGVEKSYGPVQSTPETDLAAIVPVTGLKPGTRYPYRVLVDGKPIAVPEHASINTAPDDTKPAKVRIAFGSCFHQWGLDNQEQANLIRSREPAALLLLGDIAVQDRNNHVGLHRADYLLRDFFPAWQSLVATVPVYATWDDHDYFDNDLWGIPKGYTKKDQEGVWEVFRHAWNNPSYGFGDDRRGVFLRTRIGPCDVIMTDERYFRTAPGKEGSFLGEDQMKWLEAQLLDCKGPFIILSSGTMWSDYVSDGKDSWGVWDSKGRERIFDLIEKNRIGGVLLISGDRHGARGFRIPRPSGFDFYEFEAASLGGRQGPPVTKPEWDTQLYGIADKYAFGEFTIDATVPDPEVTFRLICEDGSVIHELKLTRSLLTPPGKGGASPGGA
ncbi:MAG: alkaline phosphatase D family protein [Candidatus Sumerlaeota bacterium]|nr:alkaline phosphatase D family protein [Candidatus Sumerlaeota bacterium]